MYRSHSQKTKTFLTAHHREATIALAALLVLAVAWLFPSRSVGESFFLFLALFFAFPMLVARYLLKEPFKNFGFFWGEAKAGIVYCSVLSLIFILAEYLMIFHFKLGGRFILVRGLADGFWQFLWLETAVAIPLYFFYETFFRGFLQLGLEKKLGGYSLFLAAVLQTLTFLGNPWILIGFVLLASLSAGFIVRRSRSIVYSFIFSWIVFVSLDIMLIKMVLKGT